MAIGSRAWRLPLALLCLLALPALADSRFRINRMTRNDVPAGKGQCDIRLMVDNEVEASVRGDTVFIRTLSGRDASDVGSECNAPLPARPLNFGFEVKDSRGEIHLLSEPTRRTDWAAVVAIRDSKGGAGRYHFRLTWTITPDDYRDRGRDRNDDRRPR